MDKLSHFDQEGHSRMVDVSDKALTKRIAVAGGEISMQPATFKLIADQKIKKGNVFEVARIAGIMAAKQTPTLIPMCHPLSITAIDILFFPKKDKSQIEIEARVKIIGQTGVEMEAITAVSIAALTIYDMCKAVDRGMCISNIRLIEKSGGKSGTFKRDNQ